MKILDDLKYSDTHIHSTYSDGSNTPEQIIIKAKQLGLRKISLTDHDTISGINEFIELGKKYNIKTIAGIELSIDDIDNITDIDHLGYFENGIKHKNELINICKNIKLSRKRRVVKMVEIFNKLGFKLTVDNVNSFDKGDGLIGRSQVAKAVYNLNKDKLSCIQDVFDKFLGNGLIADVKIDHSLTLKDAIDLIHYCGGISIVAHPGVSNGKKHDKYIGLKLIEKAFEFGADGAEGIYIYHKNRPYFNYDMTKTIELCEFYTKYIIENNKLIFSGSDHHGTNKDIEIGEQIKILDILDI